MDPLEKTFGEEDRDIIFGQDARYKAGERVGVCIKTLGPGPIINASEGTIVSYNGKEEYIPPGCKFVRFEGGKTTSGRTTSSDRRIGHKYTVLLKDGRTREFGESDMFPEGTPSDYILKNAFRAS